MFQVLTDREEYKKVPPKVNIDWKFIKNEEELNPDQLYLPQYSRHTYCMAVTSAREIIEQNH